MARRVILALATLLLATGVSFADPGIRVIETDGGIRVVLEGGWAQSTYTVWRSDAATAVFAPVTSRDALCTGDCFAHDFDVVPGRSYLYRFDLWLPDGTFQQFGPYLVSIADHPVAVRLGSNPSRGPLQIELSLPGGGRDPAVPAEARILDLQGRTVRVLLRRPLERGLTAISWDGLDDRGRPLGAGLYFLRFASPLGTRVVRVTRVR